MTTLRQEKWARVARIGVRMVMIVSVLALIVVAALAFFAELAVA